MERRHAAVAVLLVEAKQRAKTTAAMHVSALTARGINDAAVAAAVALADLEDGNEAANELAGANYVVQNAHNATAGAEKRAHELKLQSCAHVFDSLEAACAVDAAVARVTTEQNQLLMTAQVSAAEFKARSECQVEGHTTLRKTLTGDAKRACLSEETARVGCIEMVRLGCLEPHCRDDKRSAGSAMSTSAHLHMAAMMQQQQYQPQQYQRQP